MTKTTPLYREFLSLPELRTTSYALESLKYEAAKLWNSLKDDMRQIISIDDFKIT